MSKFFRFYSDKNFSLGNYPMDLDDPFLDTIEINENSEGESNNDFVQDSEHCLSVICMCRDVYKKAGWLETWVHGQKLSVLPHCSACELASYSGICHNEIMFSYHKALCRSFDLVAHEVGHAIMASLKPNDFRDQANAIQESFADLTAIFARLFSPQEISNIIPSRPDDLWEVELLTRFVDSDLTQSRTLSPDIKFDNTTNNVHDMGNVLSSTVFDILAALYLSHPATHTDYVQAIFCAVEEVSCNFFNAVIASLNNLQLKVIGQKMAQKGNDDFSSIVNAQFEKHGI